MTGVWVKFNLIKQGHTDTSKLDFQVSPLLGITLRNTSMKTSSFSLKAECGVIVLREWSHFRRELW